jgi:hypothetical protein
MRITKKELTSRIGYILLGFFSFYLVEPLRNLIDSSLEINSWVIGIGGIILTLLFFDF